MTKTKSYILKIPEDWDLNSVDIEINDDRYSIRHAIDHLMCEVYKNKLEPLQEKESK